VLAGRIAHYPGTDRRDHGPDLVRVEHPAKHQRSAFSERLADVLLYGTGHIPGAVHIDWHVDLNDQDTRDYLDGAAFGT
jgi:3-mercaptopyruvate sulfurtransferase SseA